MFLTWQTSSLIIIQILDIILSFFTMFLMQSFYPDRPVISSLYKFLL